MMDLPSKEDTLTQDKKKHGIIKHIGLFGGTFDPIHLGHVQVAQDVQQRFLLEKIIFIPSAQPPHKPSKICANADDRIEMARLAVSGREDFSISDIELRRTGPSYSIDTMSYFKRTSSSDAQLYFIVGLDAFLEIETWKSYQALFDQMPFIVMSRPGIEHGDVRANWQMAKTYLQTKISAGYTFLPSKYCFTHKVKCPVYLHHVTPMDISSTQIRHHIHMGMPIDHLVAGNVGQYIKVRGLYR